MIRKLLGTTALALGIVLFGTSAARADVFVRAPFVRVQVDEPGVWVRAPFVNIYVPSTRRVIVPAPQGEPLPVPRVLPNDGNQPAVPPLTAKSSFTLDEFVNSFQARPGLYDVSLINPVTGQATPVRFSLPEGTPRRVLVNRREIEFDYGLRRFVRIQFDADGALVTAR